MPFAELLIAGILLGGLYALMACGLNLVFGVMRVINFAHGDLMAVGALTTVSLVAGLKLPYVVALVVVPLLTAAIGLAMQYFVIRRIAEAPMIMSLLATFALSTIVVNVSILIWGGGPRGLPTVLSGSVAMLGQDIPLSRFVSDVTQQHTPPQIRQQDHLVWFRQCCAQQCEGRLRGSQPRHAGNLCQCVGWRPNSR